MPGISTSRTASVDVVLLHAGHRGGPGRRGQDLVPGLLERRPQELGEAAVVVGDEDGPHARRVSGGGFAYGLEPGEQVVRPVQHQRLVCGRDPAGSAGTAGTDELAELRDAVRVLLWRP